jgi:hypothetical protein
MTTSPKVFISHASDDKDRFVLKFATKLRENGVDAWLDRWEIKPGDSLVDKIFEEGIRNADVFIIVVSATSITKPWVREELNTGIVKRIENLCRLIPVVLDDCGVPEALKHLLWVTIRDINDYEAELKRIVNTIFGTTEKPPLGEPPKHASTSIVDYLPDLTKLDNLVFAALCRQYLKVGEQLFSANEASQELKSLNLSDEEIIESIDILEGRGYIGTERSIDGQIFAVRMYPIFADAFIRHDLDGYDQVVSTIASKIVNEGIASNSVLHEQTGIVLPIVNHMLAMFDERKLIKLTTDLGGCRWIVNVSPEFKRMLR